MPKKVILPPGIGKDLDKPFLYNPYQQDLLERRRMRFCTKCKKISSMAPGSGEFKCVCGAVHISNRTAPRLYRRIGAFAGRRGGKTVVGAHLAREEMLIPNTLGWIMGPTHKVLHDSTIPTLLGLIPPNWVQHWDGDNNEITLINGSRAAFRSLDDPERGRGPGPHWGWFDEAAQCPERGWHVFRPSLAEQAGICIFTTTVFGYDWTYPLIEKPAIEDHQAGFYAVKWWTEENPLFQHDPVLREEIEEARLTYPPELFAQEYRAERLHGTGSIYGKYLTEAFKTDEQIKGFIPEWPLINNDRKILIGLDTGADHPFGAVMIVVTERGLVVVGEYLLRDQAYGQHLANIRQEFRLHRFQPMNISWAANKNERQLRNEFGTLGVGVGQAENKHQIGIPRVQSWLYTKQLVFAPCVPKTIAQMKAYRHADNYANDGQKKAVENVFKLNDELPDSIRYAVMLWPSLPDVQQAAMTDAERDRWEKLDDRSKHDIERMREYNKRNDTSDLTPVDDGYPIGDFFGSTTGGW